MKKWILVFLIAGAASESSYSHAEYRFPKANSVYRTGSYPLASCKSWNGTITELSGADTNKAVMRGAVTEEDFKEFCERQSDPSAPDAEARTKDCLANSVQLHKGETSLMSTADCRASQIRDHTDQVYTLVGPDKSAFHGLTWRHGRTDQILDGSCASGAPPVSEQFKLLCPAVAAKVLSHSQSTFEKTQALDKKSLPSSTASAAITNVPYPIQQKIDDTCEKKNVSVPKSAVNNLDFNADGVDDYIIDYGAMNTSVCPGFCGTGGCRHDFWVSAGKGRSLKYITSAQIGQIDDVEYRADKRGNSFVTLVTLMHGSNCNQSGAEPCVFRVHWNGASLIATLLSKSVPVWMGRWFSNNEIKACTEKDGPVESLLE